MSERFTDNLVEARDNGYDVVCVECGTGLAQDGCDMHEPDCSHADDDTFNANPAGRKR